MTNPSGTTTLKLRHSCDACASSKVKCHKQKPTCSRCQRRGVACHYLAVKRAGRRCSSPRVDSTRFSPQLDLSDLDAWLGTGTRPSSTDSSSDDMFLRQLLSTTTSSIGTPLIQSSAVNSASTPSNHDLFMGHSISTALTPCTTSNALGLGSGLLSPVNLSMNLDDYLPSTMNLWAPKVPETSTIDTLPPLELGHEPQPWDLVTTATAHDTCITRATQIMQQQFRHKVSLTASESACGLHEQQGRTGTPAPSLDAVIDANKQSIDAVSTMLQCQCLHDGYLLTIISLIVFKVLDLYDAAASAPEVQEPDADGPEDDATCIAAQRVLGELHRVQRLVNQLSINIKKQTASESRGTAPETSTSCGQERESEVALPFSTVTLSQLEADMRKRLKRLSLGMAASLRRD